MCWRRQATSAPSSASLPLIQLRPGMFLDNLTLESMASYLGGFSHAAHLAGNPDLDAGLEDLHDFVAEKYGYSESTAGWRNMIPDSTDQLRVFFSDVAEYLHSDAHRSNQWDSSWRHHCEPAATTSAQIIATFENHGAHVLAPTMVEIAPSVQLSVPYSCYRKIPQIDVVIRNFNAGTVFRFSDPSDHPLCGQLIQVPDSAYARNQLAHDIVATLEPMCANHMPQGTSEPKTHHPRNRGV